MSAAERLMLQHQQPPCNGSGIHHLSYDEIRAADQASAVHAINHESSSTSTRSPPSTTSGNIQADLQSETAFPSLGTPSAAPKTSGGWGTGPALSARLGRNQKNASLTAGLNSTNAFTETLVLFLSSIQIGPTPPQFREKGPRQAGEKREEDPKTLADVLRAIQRRHPTVNVESSTSRDRVTILFRSPYTLPPITSSTPPSVRSAHSLNPEERVIRARQELITRVTRKIEKVVMIPSHVKPFVIGQKGRVLKNIIESTGASVNLPPKDETTRALDLSDGSNINGPTADEMEMIPITINGEESAVLDAEDRIKAIVKERTNKVHLKIDRIPIDFYPVLDGVTGTESKLTQITQRALLEQHGIKEEDLNCRVSVPALKQLRKIDQSHICLVDEVNEDDGTDGTVKDPSIVVSGEREQVEVAIKLIGELYDDLIRKTTKVEFELPKRQHRFLDGSTTEEILVSTGSIVALPPPNDPSEKVVVRGEKMSNVQALGLVMTAANAKEVESLDLKTIHPKTPNPTLYAKQVLTYLSTKSGQTRLKQIQESCIDQVKIYLPNYPLSRSTCIELVGEKEEELKKVKETILSYVRTYLKPEYAESINVDYLLHRQISSYKKKNLKLKNLLQQEQIEMIIPNENEKDNEILLFANTLNHKKVKDEEILVNLRKVKDEVLRIVKDLANIQSSELEIPKKFHGYILGPNRTTLNAIIGEEKLVSVEIGGGSKEDSIVVRGTKDEVERVEKEIKRIAEEAKVNDTINSYTTEFEVESKHVSHLVGKGGSTVAKLREELGVRVDFNDQTNAGDHHEAFGGQHKKKKAPVKVSIVIQGRKENVEEAKKRILAQAERLADEVMVALPLISGIDRRSLVGKGGKYLTRLEDLHLVRINMPRTHSDETTGLSASDGDNIMIRGPKKGVDAVKKELIDLMEYEKEHSNTITLTISNKSIPRIVGKGGAQAEKIKEDSGIGSLDIEKSSTNGDPDGVAQVIIKGTKSSVLAAKKLINGMVQEFDDQGSLDVPIDRVHHQALIGKGGAKLRELVKKAGGDDEDAKMVRFPKSDGPESNTVTIKGSKKLISKIKEVLEKEVETLKSQVVYGVPIPRSSHPGLIGRGASGLKALQNQFKVSIHAPGWREWSAVSEVTNLKDEELRGVDPGEVFKVVGNLEACLAVAKEMKSKVVEPKERTSKVSKTVMVPKALHQQISHQGRLFRELPRGIRIDHGKAPVPGPFKAPASVLERAMATASIPPTRIDVDEEEMETQFGWGIEEISNSKGAGEEGDIAWNISGPTTEGVEKVAEMINERLNEAKMKNKNPDRPSHLAIAKVPASSMARIIGRGGSGLQMMIEESNGAIVTVIGKSGSDTISVMGDLEQLECVKKILMRLLKN